MLKYLAYSRMDHFSLLYSFLFVPAITSEHQRFEGVKKQSALISDPHRISAAVEPPAAVVQRHRLQNVQSIAAHAPVDHCGLVASLDVRQRCPHQRELGGALGFWRAYPRSCGGNE